MRAGTAQTGLFLLPFVFSRDSASTSSQLFVPSSPPSASRTFLRKSGASPKRSLAKAPKSALFFMASSSRWYSSDLSSWGCTPELKVHQAFSISSSVGFPFSNTYLNMYSSSLHFSIHSDGQLGISLMGQGTTTLFFFIFCPNQAKCTLRVSLVLLTSTNLEWHQDTRSSAKRSWGDADSNLGFSAAVLIFFSPHKVQSFCPLDLNPGVSWYG